VGREGGHGLSRAEGEVWLVQVERASRGSRLASFIPWLNCSPIPGGKRGAFYSFILFLPAIAALRGGGGQYPVISTSLPRPAGHPL
jgi:hypothetical protein